MCVYVHNILRLILSFFLDLVVLPACIKCGCVMFLVHAFIRIYLYMCTLRKPNAFSYIYGDPRLHTFVQLAPVVGLRHSEYAIIVYSQWEIL